MKLHLYKSCSLSWGEDSIGDWNLGDLNSIYYGIIVESEFYLLYLRIPPTISTLSCPQSMGLSLPFKSLTE